MAKVRTLASTRLERMRETPSKIQGGQLDLLRNMASSFPRESC